LAVIVKLRRLRMTAAEIAEKLAMPLPTVSGILTRGGIGRPGPAGARAGRPLRALAGGIARPPRRQEAGANRRRCRQRWREDDHQHFTGSYTDAAGRAHAKAGWEYVHIAVDDY
jgi:hypothetical protein